MLWRRGHLVTDDLVLTTGVVYPHPGSRMNALQVNRVMDLVESLGWRR